MPENLITKLMPDEYQWALTVGLDLIPAARGLGNF
jgi:hypothetical protein